MNARERTRNVVLILVSVAGLLASQHFGAALGGFGARHGANVSVSFGAFFILRLMKLPGNTSPWVTALYAYAVVAGGEFAQALGWYPGVFDGWDLLWNGAGVLLALAVHHVRR